MNIIIWLYIQSILKRIWLIQTIKFDGYILIASLMALKDGCDVEGILFLKKMAKVRLKDNEYDKIMIEVAEFPVHMKVFRQKMLYGATVVKWMQGHGGMESALIQNSLQLPQLYFPYRHLQLLMNGPLMFIPTFTIKKTNRLTNINFSKLLFIQANMNNIDFLSPDKSNHKITPTASTSSTNLVSNNYVQSTSKLAIDKDLENFDEIVNEDDSGEEEEENYDTRSN